MTPRAAGIRSTIKLTYNFLLQLIHIGEEERRLGVGRDEEARARGDSEAVDRGTVHQAGALELLAEIAAAVAAQPADKLLIRELLAVGELRKAESLGRGEAADHDLVGEEVLQ